MHLFSPSKPKGTLALLLASRITPLFLVSSVVVACLAYWLLAEAIRWRHHEAVRCCAIVCREFLRGRLDKDGPTERQKAALERVSRASEIRLLFGVTVNQEDRILFSQGEAFEGKAIAKRERIKGGGGTKFFIEAQTREQPMIEELARWRHILIGFCVAATLFGGSLAVGFGEVVRRKALEMERDVGGLGRRAPASKLSGMAEIAGLQEAVQGLHAFLEHRLGTLARFEEVDFSVPRVLENDGVRAASCEVSAEAGATFHCVAGCGGLAGVAPDRRLAAAVVARVGPQLCLPEGPQVAVLKELAVECHLLEMVVMDGLREKKWHLRAGLLLEEPWEIISIVAPLDRLTAQTLVEKIGALKNPLDPGAMLGTLCGSVHGPAAMVLVVAKPPAHD